MRTFIQKNKKSMLFTGIVMAFLLSVGISELVVTNLNQPTLPVGKVEPEEKKEVKSEEVVKSPVPKEAQVVRYFYDPNAADEQLENALIYFEGVYRPNMGIDYTMNGEVFDIYASISGEVTKKTNDPLLGWIVTITNDKGVATTYQSLSEVKVDEGAKVKQGAVLGKSGQNVYESDLKNHLHFIVEVNDVVVNPQDVLDKEITKLN